MTNSPRLETEAMRQLRGALVQRGLNHWWPVLAQLLPQFDGWVAAMEVDRNCEVEDSAAWEIVESLLAWSKSVDVSDLQFARMLSQADFLCRCARSGRSRRHWNPMMEAFSMFRVQDGDQAPDVYEYPPCEPVWYYWLLGRLYAAQQGSDVVLPVS